MRCRQPALLVMLAAVPLACGACGTSSLEVLGPRGGTALDASVDASGPAGRDAGADGSFGDAASLTDALSDASPRAIYCSGTGSPILVGDGEAGAVYACLGGLSQTSFRWAVCTCDAIVASAPITTDSFNGALGAYDAAAALSGGGVGTNGELSAGAVTVGGTLWVSDSKGMTLTTASASGELHVGGRVSVGPSLSVTDNAYVLGDIVASGSVTIGGTLYQLAGAVLNAASETLGGRSDAAFTVPSACDCDPSVRVDVAGYVASYAATNDDLALSIDPTVLANVTSPLALSIPCGRIYFTSVGGAGAIHLELAAGRTAIFVGGDLSPAGDFSVSLPPGAEVDLFVAGNVSAGGAFTLGSAATPAGARLWVGGDGTINLPNATTLAGNVYAPLAELVTGTSPTTVYGSIFVNRLSSQGALTVHYDESILSAGATCASSTTCQTCRDCGNQACNGGVCGACTQSSDCCAPLRCISGSCTVSPPP